MQNPYFMKKVLFISFWFFLGQCLAQQKGVTPVVPSNNNPEGTVRAVVIGISDYEDEGIPDLQFADKDAELFADWLYNSNAGSLNPSNIKLLVNQNATQGKIGAALGWLIEDTKEGDVAVIYFSGHGDVENTILGDPGYLLVWDSPSKSYMLSAFSIDDLKRIVNTLSIVNKAKVILITDACRAGKLAGSAINGTGLTNQNLSERFGNEIKVLSCQPNEYSFEGEQWGGGHGAFTYYLSEGLYGLADNNSDLKVTLSELGRYLEDNVTEQVAPRQQIPVVIGNRAESITLVNEQALAEHKKGGGFQVENFSKIENRGLEEELLAGVDTSVIRKYELFKTALVDNKFFDPPAVCAEDLYQELTAIPELKPLHNQMRRDYAAALQDDAQQFLNRMIFKPELEMDIWYSPTLVEKHYGPQPVKLERAAELLGPDHYMYPILQARKYLFKGAIQYMQCSKWKNILSGTLAIKHFKESLKWQPNAPHTYLWMADTFWRNLQELDSAVHYFDLAIEHAPTWRLPRHEKAIYYSENGKFNLAKEILEQEILVDSTDGNYWYSMSGYYFFQGKYKESIEKSMQAIANSPESLLFRIEPILPLGFLGKKDEAMKIFNEVVDLYPTNGHIYYFMANMYFLLQEYHNAIPYFQQAIAKDSSMIWAYSHLGDTYIYLDSIEQAKVILKKGYEQDSTYMPLINSMGGLYAGKKDHKQAKYFFEKAIELDPSSWPPHYNLALTNTAQHAYEKAIDNLRLAFDKGMKNELKIYYGKGYEFFRDDPELDPLKEMEGYKELMRENFADEYKE